MVRPLPTRTLRESSDNQVNRSTTLHKSLAGWQRVALRPVFGQSEKPPSLSLETQFFAELPLALRHFQYQHTTLSTAGHPRSPAWVHWDPLLDYDLVSHFLLLELFLSWTIGYLRAKLKSFHLSIQIEPYAHTARDEQLRVLPWLAVAAS